MNNRLRLYIEIMLVVCIFVLILILTQKKETLPDESGQISELLLQKLNEQKRDYELKITVLKIESEAFIYKIDSLNNLKKEIKIIYIDRIKKIDNLNTSQQAISFQKIFSKNGITQ